MELDQYCTIAHQLADAAGAVTAGYFRQAVTVEHKADETPVTRADREAEQAMRAILAAELPEHAVIGEEYGQSGMQMRWRWMLDPIDGTRSFIAGRPLFTTLIALLEGNHSVIGVIDQPVLKERWVAVSGKGATWNGETIHTRRCTSVKDAYLTATSPHIFNNKELHLFERVRQRCRETLYGMDAYGYGLLAAGHLDLVIEADMKPYDYAPLVPIITEAGGVVTDWEGKALSFDRTACILAAATPELHREALHYLHGET